MLPLSQLPALLAELQAIDKIAKSRQAA